MIKFVQKKLELCLDGSPLFGQALIDWGGLIGFAALGFSGQTRHVWNEGAPGAGRPSQRL